MGADSSGSQPVTGSSSWIRPSSTSNMAAAAAIGLVMEAIRKIVSLAMGALLSRLSEPAVRTSTWPPRASIATAPGTEPLCT